MNHCVRETNIYILLALKDRPTGLTNPTDRPTDRPTGGDRGSELPASCTLYSQFPPLPFFVSCFFLLLNITQCCQKNVLFLLVAATLGILLPNLSSPTCRRLLAPFTIYPWVPTPCPSPPPSLFVFGNLIYIHPILMIFFILVTCLLDDVLLL